MEKRAVIAIILSILVLLSFKYIEDRRMSDLAKGRQQIPKVTSTLPAPQAPLVSTPPPSTQAPAPILTTDTVAEVRTLVIDGPLFRAVLDNRGAVITSFKLKKYKSDKGEIFELIAAAHDSDSRPYPGSLILDDPKSNQAVNGELYEVVVQSGEKGQNSFAPPVDVALRLRRGEIIVEKRYSFQRENYLVDYSVSVERGEKAVAAKILLGQDIGPEHEHLLNPASQLQAISNIAAKIHRDGPPKDENEIRRIDGEVRWVGLGMHYFSVIAIPTHALASYEIQKRPVKTIGLDGKEVARDLLRLTIPMFGSSQFLMYLGPKDQEVLEAVKGADLSGVIDFGMFSIIVRPLLVSLKFIEHYVHNWGVAIIILTFVLTLALFPFRLKQMISMKKMAVVQPKVKEIQERFKRYKKTDPKRAEMNQEIMGLYKEHNVNPLGGCLPLLLQMPLLFAFYQLLASSIELRQAEFFMWLRDLSVKDPYYVLPIIMGITMLISQKMTPMSPGTDPTQAKMMMMMPIIFTVMFLNVSAGLNLYFLCSNIFSIALQKIAERWMGERAGFAKSKS